MVVAIAPANGTATIDDSGAFTYTPTRARSPGSTRSWCVGCDDGDPVLCDSGHVTVTVTPARGGRRRVDHGRGPGQRRRRGQRSRHRSVPPTVVSAPANGTATVEADGTITYAPTPGFTGTDTFDYEICSTVSPSVCAHGDGDGRRDRAPTSHRSSATRRRDHGHRPGDRERHRQRPGSGQTVTMTVVGRRDQRVRHRRRHRGLHLHARPARSPASDSVHGPGLRRRDAEPVRHRVVTVTVSPLAVDDTGHDHRRRAGQRRHRGQRPGHGRCADRRRGPGERDGDGRGRRNDHLRADPASPAPTPSTTRSAARSRRPSARRRRHRRRGHDVPNEPPGRGRWRPRRPRPPSGDRERRRSATPTPARRSR